MKKFLFLSVPLCSLLAAAAFAADIPATPAHAAETAAPAVSPGHGGMMPAAAAEPQAPEVRVNISGKVLQTMNATGYSYIYIEQADGSKRWVAVTEVPVKVGAEMTFKPGTEMGRFESKSLKRTFDSIVFSEGVISGADKGAIIDPGKGQGVSPGSQGATADKSKKISVPKATGANAVTVEEAYKNSAKLNKKKIVIRGQVVKVSLGIMNKTWIHIQDGTGSEKKKTHNLVCTTATGNADVGDVITVTGTLIKDKDFGAGYKYAVIVEDAKVSK